MTAYLKKSFVQHLHYRIEHKLPIILMPLTPYPDGGVLVYHLVPDFFELSGRHDRKFLPRNVYKRCRFYKAKILRF